MRKVSHTRVAFIEKILLEKLWEVQSDTKNSKMTTLKLSEVNQIIRDVQLGKTFIHTVNGRYIVDGGMSYAMKEVKL